jgi:hypothetical protein
VVVCFFFFVLCAYYIIRPLRDEMGVSLGPARLQWLFSAVFVVMLAAVPLFGLGCLLLRAPAHRADRVRLSDRQPPRLLGAVRSRRARHPRCQHIFRVGERSSTCLWFPCSGA